MSPKYHQLSRGGGGEQQRCEPSAGSRVAQEALRARARKASRRLNSSLQLTQEGDQVALFVGGQLGLQDQVEKLDGVFQGKQAAVMKVRRRFLDAAQAEILDRALGSGFHAVDHLRLEETLDLQVVHGIVGVIRSRVARGALRLAEEQRLPLHFRGLLAELSGIQLAVDAQIRRRRKVEQVLELGHEVNLRAAVQAIDAFDHCRHGVAVEVSR